MPRWPHLRCLGSRGCRSVIFWDPQICATAAALPLAVALCSLCVWNAWLVSQNKTTIEYHEARFGSGFSPVQTATS